jgi:hypothetical protein
MKPFRTICTLTWICLFHEFNPRPAIEYWWKQRSNRSAEPASAKEQEWFLKTFSEASEKMKEKRKKTVTKKILNNYQVINICCVIKTIKNQVDVVMFYDVILQGVS